MSNLRISFLYLYILEILNLIILHYNPVVMGLTGIMLLPIWPLLYQILNNLSKPYSKKQKPFTVILTQYLKVNIYLHGKLSNNHRYWENTNHNI